MGKWWCLCGKRVASSDTDKMLPVLQVWIYKVLKCRSAVSSCENVSFTASTCRRCPDLLCEKHFRFWSKTKCHRFDSLKKTWLCMCKKRSNPVSMFLSTSQSETDIFISQLHNNDSVMLNISSKVQTYQESCSKHYFHFKWGEPEMISTAV